MLLVLQESVEGVGLIFLLCLPNFAFCEDQRKVKFAKKYKVKAVCQAVDYHRPVGALIKVSLHLRTFCIDRRESRL
jgi:hypothetical protein